MGRSQLLNELVNGTSELENVLLRLKVILSDLENENIMSWVVGELEGFEIENIPDYRIIKGAAMGMFVVNQVNHYKNSQVPLEHLISAEEIDKIVTVHITDGISVIESLLRGENANNYAKSVPTAFCHYISTINLQILSMEVKCPSNIIKGIVSKVKSKLVDIILELEKQFDDLDGLDIKSQVEEDKTKRINAVYNIENIIYEGNIEIGDGNKIGKSRLGFFGKNK